jgi:folate-binding protein YgfZ
MSELPYSTIIVTGNDAFGFLQAQLAADLSQLGGHTSLSRVHPDRQQHGVSGYAILSAWCNPKGRVICLFRVARIEQGYSLTLPTQLTDDVVQRLTMFRFRANVDFSILPATVEELGVEVSFDEWRLANLRAGIPEILQPQSEHFTPHMLNLDLLGAVSVDKGCYPGQEIVARTHFRGVTKRRCLRFESTEPVSPGDKVSDGQGDVGEILNAIGTDLLAVVPVEKADKPLFVGETKLLHFALPYQ